MSELRTYIGALQNRIANQRVEIERPHAVIERKNNSVLAFADRLKSKVIGNNKEGIQNVLRWIDDNAKIFFERRQ
ncbi:MAG: hypothetical protein IJW83_00030 [Clostridia bacterium]|nr:hypothetical protein [Clostridia bacterium]